MIRQIPFLHVFLFFSDGFLQQKKHTNAWSSTQILILFPVSGQIRMFPSPLSSNFHASSTSVEETAESPVIHPPTIHPSGVDTRRHLAPLPFCKEKPKTNEHPLKINGWLKWPN